MSRFNNLEIGQVDRKENQGDVVRDEAWHLAEAANLYQSGRYDLALRSYSRVLEHNSSNAHAWCSQVRMLVELGEYREAKLWVDKALERFPKDPELLAAKAVVLARVGEPGRGPRGLRSLCQLLREHVQVIGNNRFYFGYCSHGTNSAMLFAGTTSTFAPSE